MKTYYELLGVAPQAAADEIKRAFRREIARYHPDKVQHLGPEFQEIAATRAAELTEAYRILMDVVARERYDSGLAEAPSRAPVTPPPTYTEPARQGPFEPPPPAPPGEAAGQDRRFQRERATTTDVVRKAVLARFRAAVDAVVEGAVVSTAASLDAAYSLKAKGGLFRKAGPPLRLVVKCVEQVDAAAIRQAWPSAVASGTAGETVCLLLLGSGLAPARELSAAVAELRRTSQKPVPVVVPVDVRDWEVLFPPDAPAPVRAILQRLRAGDA